MTVINTRPDHPSEFARILQVVPVASSNAKPKFRVMNTTTGLDSVENHLQLTVRGLKYMKQRQKAIFHMFCDKVGLVGYTYHQNLIFGNKGYRRGFNTKARASLQVEWISCLQLEIRLWLPTYYHSLERTRKDARGWK